MKLLDLVFDAEDNPIGVISSIKHNGTGGIDEFIVITKTTPYIQFYQDTMTAKKVLKAQEEYHKANKGLNKVIYQIQDIYKKGFDAVCEHLKSLEAK